MLKQGRSHNVSQRYTQFFKSPSTAPTPSNLDLEAIASYFLHHQLDNTMLYASGSQERI